MWMSPVALHGNICSAVVIATAAATFDSKLCCCCCHFTLVHCLQDRKTLDIIMKSALEWCESVLHVLVLIISSCWSLLRCSCVADSLQVALWCPLSAARLSPCLLTWWTPSSPPHHLTCPSSSITIRVPGSVRRPPPLCLGGWAEPFPSAPSPRCPGQVSVKY